MKVVAERIVEPRRVGVEERGGVRRGHFHGPGPDTGDGELEGERGALIFQCEAHSFDRDHGDAPPDGHPLLVAAEPVDQRAKRAEHIEVVR
jgi:hypothetical protein